MSKISNQIVAGRRRFTEPIHTKKCEIFIVLIMQLFALHIGKIHTLKFILISIRSKKIDPIRKLETSKVRLRFVDYLFQEFILGSMIYFILRNMNSEGMTSEASESTIILFKIHTYKYEF